MTNITGGSTNGGSSGKLIQSYTIGMLLDFTLLIFLLLETEQALHQHITVPRNVQF